MEKQELKMAVGYCRVSTKKQEKVGLSLDAQESFIREFVKQDGFGLVKVFKVQESGGDSERKHLFRTFDYCLENGIQDILITDNDRWMRSREMDIEAQKYIKKHDLRVHILREKKLIGKFGTIDDELFHNLMVDFNDAKLKKIRFDILTGIKEKLSRNEYPGSLPIGYKSIRKTEHTPHTIIQTEDAPKVKQFLEDFSAGKMTVFQSIHHAQIIGLKPKTKDAFTKGALAKLVKSKFYYGDFDFSHEWINDGNSVTYRNETKGFEPLITKKVWQKNQDILKQRQKNLKEDQGRGKSFKFNHLMVCGKCERAIFAEQFSAVVKYKTKKKGTTEKTYKYQPRYHCTRGNYFTVAGTIIQKKYVDEEKLVVKEDITYIDESGETKIWLKKGKSVEAHTCDMPRFSEDEIEQMLMDKISLIKFNTKHWEEIKKTVWQDDQKEYLDFEIRSLRNEQTKNDIKLDKMYSEYTDGIIDAEFLKTRSAKIRMRQNEIKDRLPELEDDREAYDKKIGKSIELLDSLKNWDKILKEATNEKLKNILDLMTIKISTSWRKTERQGKTYEHRGLWIELVPEVRELFDIGILEASEKWDKEHKIRMPSFNSPKLNYSRSDH